MADDIGTLDVGNKDTFFPISALTSNNTIKEVTPPTPCASQDASKEELKAACSLLMANMLAKVMPPARARDKLID
jgi:hypothetical protein